MRPSYPHLGQLAEDNPAAVQWEGLTLWEPPFKITVTPTQRMVATSTEKHAYTGAVRSCITISANRLRELLKESCQNKFTI